MVKSRHLFALESDSIPHAQNSIPPSPSSITFDPGSILPAQSSITFDPGSITFDLGSVLPAPSGRAFIFPITERHHTAHYIDIAFYRGYGAR